MSINSVLGFDAFSATTPYLRGLGRALGVRDVERCTDYPAATTPPANPSLAGYSQITTASSVVLMRSVSPGTTSALSNLSESDSPANRLSGISSMMDALKAGMAQGMFSGTGFDIVV